MSKIITIKLTTAGARTGPFTITDQFGNVIATNVSKKSLIRGISYEVDNIVDIITIESTGECALKKSFSLESITLGDYASLTYTQSTSACLWRHLTDIHTYNYFYGNIEPYIIEYPFAYQYQDEILQNVKDYTKAYEYVTIPDGVFNDNTRIETNNKWFNKRSVFYAVFTRNQLYKHNSSSLD